MVKYIWVFNGARSSFPSGVFELREDAQSWIAENKLTGTLTKYPVGQGVYQWAIDEGAFEPKRDDQKTPEFIGKFSSASLEHYHYEDGE